MYTLYTYPVNAARHNTYWKTFASKLTVNVYAHITHYAGSLDSVQFEHIDKAAVWQYNNYLPSPAFLLCCYLRGFVVAKEAKRPFAKMRLRRTRMRNAIKSCQSRLRLYRPGWIRRKGGNDERVHARLACFPYRACGWSPQAAGSPPSFLRPRSQTEKKQKVENEGKKERSYESAVVTLNGSPLLNCQVIEEQENVIIITPRAAPLVTPSPSWVGWGNEEEVDYCEIKALSYGSLSRCLTLCSS